MRSRPELDQVRAARHGSADAGERDAAGGPLPRARRAATRRRWPRCSTRSCPRRSPRCGRRAAGWSAPTVMVTGHELTWDMVPYDVQLIGGIVLHQGRIAEMATGEGKTLVATLPLYLNALAGRGAHLVTVNNYLARRDSQWMGHVFRWLGLTVGCLDDTEPSTPERRAAYLVRHHLRHEQRVRLRLPARQHGVRRWSSACSASTSTPSSTKWTRS